MKKVTPKVKITKISSKNSKNFIIVGRISVPFAGEKTDSGKYKKSKVFQVSSGISISDAKKWDKKRSRLKGPNELNPIITSFEHYLETIVSQGHLANLTTSEEWIAFINEKLKLDSKDEKQTEDLMSYGLGQYMRRRAKTNRHSSNQEFNTLFKITIPYRHGNPKTTLP